MTESQLTKTRTSANPRPDTTELQPHLAEWGLSDSYARAVKRSTSTMAELDAFYQAMMPRMEEIIDYLDQFPLREMPAEDRPLADAALAVCEVDFAVNKWRTPNLVTGYSVQQMPEKSSPYDSSPITRT